MGKHVLTPLHLTQTNVDLQAQRQDLETVYVRGSTAKAEGSNVLQENWHGLGSCWLLQCAKSARSK